MDPRALLHKAMDAAREALAEEGVTISRGCLFFELENTGEPAMRLGASYPEGDFLAASDLAVEGARAFSMQAALAAFDSEGNHG